MAQIPGYSFTVMATGDAQWHRDVAAPLGAEVNTLVPYYKGELPAPLVTPNRGPMNAWIGLVILGVTVFVAKTLTEKFLADVYTEFQPNIKAFLSNLKAKLKLNGGNQKAKKAFHFDAWYYEYDVLVSVAVIGTTFDEIDEQLHLVRAVHANAITWIRENGTQKPIHLYEIENGKVSPAPVLLENISQIRVN
jgi:hypothetical protein